MMCIGSMAVGMPAHKYVTNLLLTAFQNICTGAKLSEYHTGYRAFSAELLKSLDFESFSDAFIFDNQILDAILARGHVIGEITSPTLYFEDASSINFGRSGRSAVGGLPCCLG